MGSNNQINDRTGKRESWLTRAEYRIENDRGKRRTQCRKVVPKSVLVFGVPAEVLRVVIAQAEEWKVGGRKFGDCPFDCTPLKTRNRIMSAMMVKRNEQDRARKEMEFNFSTDHVFGELQIRPTARNDRLTAERICDKKSGASTSRRNRFKEGGITRDSGGTGRRGKAQLR